MITGASVPPPEEARKKSPAARIFSRVFLIGLALLVLATVASIFDITRKLDLKAARVKIQSEQQQIFMALMDFDEKYGGYPSEKTLAKLAAEKGAVPWPLVSSNDYLRQLVLAGLIGQEHFHDRDRSKSTGKPGGVVSPPEKALSAGECAYAYIPNDSNYDSRPILLYPMVPGTLRFDPKPLKGVAMMLTAEGVRERLEITEDGRVIVSGADIFDPAQPWWGGKVPEVKYPEARAK